MISSESVHEAPFYCDFTMLANWREQRPKRRTRATHPQKRFPSKTCISPPTAWIERRGHLFLQQFQLALNLGGSASSLSPPRVPM